jgi:DNA invertase Pin-like site-specific DNA recombinase
MTANSPIPAAQYLRMSTDYQQYSLDNQADAITQYAQARGFSVVKTYTDAAKSGLRLKNRNGLKQLLKDVVDGKVDYRAILVYDVSRWGRFQDTDESAHYEYLCKSARIPVHYCAETFENDNSMPALIMKTLKRTMAGEYSRELSAKVRAGLARLAKKGFKLGGPPPYGFRRMLVDSEGRPRQLLLDGQRKCIANERVILVPGPAEEITIVRRIFREFVEEHRSLRSIASRLNNDGIPFIAGGRWGPNTVTKLLKHPNYIGSLVWGRTTAYLGGRAIPMPQQDWVVCPNAFDAIIDEEQFTKAQVTFHNFTCRLSDDDMLERLRAVLRSEGKLSSEIIQDSRSCPGLTTYYKRIGGLLNAYKRLGYLRPDLAYEAATSRQRKMLIRSELMKALVEHSEGEFKECRKSRVFRAVLKRRRTGLLVSVVLARCYATVRRGIRWVIAPPKNERKRVTVLALLNETNCSIKQIRVFRRMPKRKTTMYVGDYNRWLNSGVQLHEMADLSAVIGKVRSSGVLGSKSQMSPCERMS